MGAGPLDGWFSEFRVLWGRPGLDVVILERMGHPWPLGAQSLGGGHWQMVVPRPQAECGALWTRRADA